MEEDVVLYAHHNLASCKMLHSHLSNIFCEFFFHKELLNMCIFLFFSGWKCSRCDLTSNLWMNLTDGTILCGRKYFDGELVLTPPPPPISYHIYTIMISVQYSYVLSY